MLCTKEFTNWIFNSLTVNCIIIMKIHNTYPLIVFLFLTSICISQIPNPSFENWTSNSPDGWHDINEQGPYDFVTQEANAHDGNSAVRSSTLQTGPVVNYSIFLTSNFSTWVDAMYGYVSTSVKPYKLRGWYILENDGVDTLVVNIQLKKNGIVIGSGDFETWSATSIYTQFELDINYSSGDMPDSMRIEFDFNHANVTSNTAGRYFIIDDLTLDLTNSISESENTPNNLKVYPNPTNNLLTFQNLNSSNISTIEIYDLTGKLVHSSTPNTSYHHVNIESQESGIYIYKVWIGGGSIITGRIVKQ